MEELTFRPDAYYCDWCRSRRTWNVVAGRIILNHDAVSRPTVAERFGAERRPHLDNHGWYCGRSDWSSMPAMAPSNCEHYHQTFPRPSSWLGNCGSWQFWPPMSSPPLHTSKEKVTRTLIHQQTIRSTSASQPADNENHTFPLFLFFLLGKSKFPLLLFNSAHWFLCLCKETKSLPADDNKNNKITSLIYILTRFYHCRGFCARKMLCSMYCSCAIKSARTFL